MSEKPTYEELEKRIQDLEHVDLARKEAEGCKPILWQMHLNQFSAYPAIARGR